MKILNILVLTIAALVSQFSFANTAELTCIANGKDKDRQTWVNQKVTIWFTASGASMDGAGFFGMHERSPEIQDFLNGKKKSANVLKIDEQGVQQFRVSEGFLSGKMAYDTDFGDILFRTIQIQNGDGYFLEESDSSSFKVQLKGCTALIITR